jgi:hypothetical protein
MKASSAEFRGEVLAACDTGEERSLIALRFGVSEGGLARREDRRSV